MRFFIQIKPPLICFAQYLKSSRGR